MGRDIVAALVLFGMPALVIYGLGRLVPFVAILCALVTAVLLFVFVVAGGALSTASPLWLLTSLGPLVGLSAALLRARPGKRPLVSPRRPGAPGPA